MSPRTRSHGLIAAALLTLFSSPSSRAADGLLDTSFRGTGKFLFAVASLGGRSAAVAPDGRLLIGYTALLSGSDSDLRVVPVPDGGSTTFCASYHPDQGGTDEDRLADIAVDGNRVYLAGASAGPPDDSDFRVAIGAFDLTTCALDSTFGGGHGAILNSTVSFEATAIRVDAFGDLLVAAQLGPAGARDLLSMRVSPTAVVDQIFEVDLFTPLGAESFETQGLFVQPDGKRVIVGTAVLPGGDRDVAVVRLTASGTLDSTFSGDGILSFSYDIIDAGADEGLAVAVLPGGKIVIGGRVQRAVGSQAAVALITPTGGFDNAFGSVGRFAFDFLGAQRADSVRALVLQGNGKIVAAGDTGPAALSDRDFAVARLHSAGAQPLDASFGNSGRTIVPFDEGGSIADVVHDMTLGQGGRITLVGSVATAAGTAVAAARLQNAYIFADGFEWGNLIGSEWGGVWGGIE